LGIESSYAGQPPILPEPLLKQGTLPPEEADGPFQYRSRRKKYFLVIAVNQTDVPKTDLPFAKVDGQRVLKALTGLGYQPMDPAHPMLTGQVATQTAIVASIKKARSRNEEATLLVYYTGHGAVGAKDLWLQTAGQEEVGEGQGVEVSDLIRLIRFTASQKGPEKAFEGELVLILDACYSGQGIVSQGLTLGELGKHTTILTSSSDIQESLSLNHPDLPKMSAFTHTLLQGMGPEWGMADDDGDGILRWEELAIYAEGQLRSLKKAGAITHAMEPWMVSNYRKGLLAYQRDQVRVWNSSYRAILTTDEANKILAAHLQQLEATPEDKLALPQEAQLLAQTLEPAPEDSYAQAVKATAEGRLENARALFAKAEAQSQERATHADAVIQRETEKQGQIYLASARMEMYAGRFTEAFGQYQRAATISPPTTPELLNELGVAGLRAGKYAEALPYLTEALRQREHTLTPSHPDVAISLNNLALLYQAQGEYAKAEPLHQRTLAIREKALGPDHPDVATSLNNLAGLYRAQGEYAKAEPLHQRALAIREKALGPDHPDVAMNLNNLAALYYSQGQYSKAEPLFQRSFWIAHNGLGPKHPTVKQVFANYQASLKGSGQPHSENDVWEKLSSSSYAPTSKTSSP